MAATSEFFGSRNPQAVLKHGILTHYAYYFAGRAGAATEGRVAFIDGYAGQGRYEDGNPGSPLLLAAEAERVGLIRRDVTLAFVEPNPDHRAKLIESLKQSAVPADQIDARPFSEAATELLDRYTGRAVFLFVDPFGLGITFQTLLGILRRRSPRQPIDVRYHFSLSAAARMGRNAIGVSSGAEANAALVDAALGPGGWRDVFPLVDTGTVTATQAALQVARRFGNTVEHETGIRSTAIEVRRHGHGHRGVFSGVSGHQKLPTGGQRVLRHSERSPWFLRGPPASLIAA